MASAIVSQNDSSSSFRASVSPTVPVIPITTSALYTNMRAQIPDPIYQALEDAGIGGVFQASPKFRDDCNGLPSEWDGMYSNTLCSRYWRISSPVDREAARKAVYERKHIIFINRWLPRDEMILPLLHELGHHISYKAGVRSYLSPEWLREADANEKLKQSARASFDGPDRNYSNHNYLSKDGEEIATESIGRLLGGISLPVRLKNFALRVIGESGVKVSIPLFKVKLRKPKPSPKRSEGNYLVPLSKSSDGRPDYLVPTSSLPPSLLREFYRKERARAREVRP
jgi:hypothetical protein